ncbi:MAG TPA: hypothetical protein VF290_02870, partial [Pyrinomonadaceae bacterium]
MKRIPFSISLILLLCFYANAQTVDEGATTKDGTYINFGFGFSFKYPKEWTVHGEATNERIRELGKEKMAETGALSKPNAEVALKNTYHLLTVFRHPVGTPGVAFNPAILVIAERVDHAPGIKSGKDYLLNLRTVLLKTGAQALLKEPVEYRVGGSEFFRDSFALENNGVHAVQTFFSKIANGYALVFIFIGEDEKSVDEMSKAMETFTPS